MADISSGLKAIGKVFAPAAKAPTSFWGKLGAGASSFGGGVLHYVNPLTWIRGLSGAASSVSSGVSKAVVGGTAVGGGKGVLWLIQQPFAYALHGVAHVGSAARAHPVTAGIVGAVVATGAIAGMSRGKAQRRTQQELLNQAATQQQNPYQVSPEDAAMLDAKMKQGGRSSGFASAELAARGQDQQAVR